MGVGYMQEITFQHLSLGAAIVLIMVLMALILINRKVHHNFNLEFAAEGVAREMLLDRKWPYRTFRVLRYHLCGFTDDQRENVGVVLIAFNSNVRTTAYHRAVCREDLQKDRCGVGFSLRLDGVHDLAGQTVKGYIG